MSATTTLNDAKETAGDIRRSAGPWIERFARFGYAAKGCVYVIVGVLAAMAAAGAGGRTTGTHGAMHEILQQPFGRVLLAIIAAGLSGFGVWQIIRSVEDADNAGSDFKGIAKRIGWFFSGLGYFLLCVGALRLIFFHTGGGDASGSGDENTRSWTATIMSYTFGRYAIAGVGIGVGIYGLFNLFFANRAQLEDQVMLKRINSDDHNWKRWIGRVGIGARGAVFVLIGWFFIVAAWHEKPEEARGIGGALKTLEQQPYGPWILGIVAVGLIAYGVFQLLLARYRVIKTD